MSTPSSTKKDARKPVAVCGECSRRVRSVCAGLCPSCYQAKADSSAVLSIYIERDQLKLQVARLQRRIRRAIREAASKKDLVARLERLLVTKAGTTKAGT
jgi:predicted amidophosphoribosyltransferase